MKCKNVFKKNQTYLFLKYHFKRQRGIITRINRKDYPLVWKKIYFKEYERFPNFYLPLPKIKKANLFETLLKRRSLRKGGGKITLNELSSLLYFCAGINLIKKNSFDDSKRFYPSAGARYPLEIYLFNFSKIDFLKPGVYHYNVRKHSLELLKKGFFLKKCKGILNEVNKDMLKKNSIFVVISAVFGRTLIKYGELSYKLILLEAGHLGQNLQLIATFFKINSCPIGWIDEKKINKLLNLEFEKELMVYAFILNKN